MPSKNKNKINTLKRELNRKFFERSAEIDSALVAILASEHMLQLGEPGTAKSALTRAICNAIEGASYFERLLTKFSKEEEIFGPTSVKQLANDVYTRKVDGKLPTAHIAFIDEIFKANSAILNALLTVINERIYHNDPVVECPLISVFGASNEMPQGDTEGELNALFDRFLLRHFVKYITEDSNMRALLTADDEFFKIETKISLVDLEKMQQTAMDVTVSDEIIDAIIALRSKMGDEGIIISDRRWKKTIKILKAKAYLDGRDAVADADFDILANVLWEDVSQIKMAEQLVTSVANPFAAKALEKLDTATEIYNNALAAASGDAGAEANKKLKDILKDIKELIETSGQKSTTKLIEVQERINTMNREVVAKCLGVDLT